MDKKYDCIIIGGGAAGLLTAARLDLTAFSPKGAGLILEATDSPGTKLRMSGAGHCNFTHDGSVKDMVAAYGEQGRAIRRVLYRYNNDAFVDFLDHHGIPSFSRDGGRVFPKSQKAQDVLNLLLNLSAENGFALKKGFRVSQVTRLPDAGWQVACDNGAAFRTAAMVIATGGKSFPATGSNGRMWDVLSRDLDVEVISPRPVLAPVAVRSYPYGPMAGLSFETAELSVTAPGKKIQRSVGDLLLTHRDFSGPAALNICGAAEPGDTLHINYVYPRSREDVTGILSGIFSGKKGNPVSAMASQLNLPRRFCQSILLRSLGKPIDAENVFRGSWNVNGLSPKKVAALLCDDTFTVESLPDWNKAMATRGGIALSQLDLRTMEFREHPGLFAVGEALDVDGITGGYNLQFAFSSASVCAEALQKKLRTDSPAKGLRLSTEK